MEDYAERVREQQAQYFDGSHIHTTNAAIELYRRTAVAPLFQRYFGVSSHVASYAETIMRVVESRVSRGPASRPTRILSVGCGDLTLEEQIARILLDRDLTHFELHGIDLAPHLLEAADARLRATALRRHFRLEVVDVNRDWVAGPFDVVLAHHSLHHVANLEHVFDAIDDALPPHGALVSCDVIGRNGHLLWPEAREIVDSIWADLPARLRYDNVYRRVDDSYVDLDCSAQGFEGIRAQDILPNLVDRFHPAVFAGYGGITDPFVGKRFGPNFDLDYPGDYQLLSRLIDRNRELTATYRIKPTRMIGVFRKRGWPEPTEGNLDPGRCIHPLAAQ